MKRLLVILLLLSSNAYAGDWDTEDKVLFSATIALNLVDGLQSRQIHQQPEKYYEQFPGAPKHPTDMQILAGKLATIGGTYWLADKLNERNRKILLWAETAILTAVIVHNHQLGLSVSF